MTIIHDYDDEDYDALKQRQQWADKQDTGKDCRISFSGPKRICHSGGAWCQRTLHRSYKMHVMKTGYIITKTAHYMKQTQMTTHYDKPKETIYNANTTRDKKQYLRQQASYK